MRVDFYHLTRQPIERVLPQIAERVLGEGGRLLILERDDEARAGIDRLLWTYVTDSFLPHAERGGAADADQPILLAAEPDGANGARHVMLADGIWREAALAFDRTFYLFDEEEVEGARAAWRALAGRDGLERHYWKQTDEGRWARAA